VLFTFVVVAVAQTTSPDSGPAGTTGSESIGNRLLDDLPPVGSPDMPRAVENRDVPASEPRSRAMPQVANHGEDIGGANGPLLLARVRNDMQQAGMLLGQPIKAPNASTIRQAGDMQNRVVAQLDELIAELSKQCQGGQCHPNANPSPQPSQRSAAKPSQSNRTASSSSVPARDSKDPLNGAEAKPVDKRDVDELVKHLWGHLPERSREQVLQSFSDEFLPQYELEIEQYYRRLSEGEPEHLPR
jgi:hypothetical protein